MSAAMAYVACDPAQPGTAYAIVVDRPELAQDTAATVAEWIAEGAQIQRVTVDDGVAMVQAWKRPARATGETT